MEKVVWLVKQILWPFLWFLEREMRRVKYNPWLSNKIDCLRGFLDD